MLDIKGYLERFEFLRIGALSIRRHRIRDIDRTPFLHTHPFSYMSLIVRGGYSEQVLVGNRLTMRTHVAGKLVFRSNSTPHRIVHVKPGTVTLFFAYYHGSWELIRYPGLDTPEGYHDLPDGMYRDSRNFKWKRREDGKWFTSEFSYAEAKSSQRLSIFQNLDEEVLYQHALDTPIESVQRSGLPGVAGNA